MKAYSVGQKVINGHKNHNASHNTIMMKIMMK